MASFGAMLPPALTEPRTFFRPCRGGARLALALATRPRVLLLDEPTAGMSGAETERTIGLIADLVRTEGLTVLFSEHDMDVVFGISQHITVLHQGRVIADGTGAQVRANEEVTAVYLGGAGHGDAA